MCSLTCVVLSVCDLGVASLPALCGHSSHAYLLYQQPMPDNTSVYSDYSMRSGRKNTRHSRIPRLPVQTPLLPAAVTFMFLLMAPAAFRCPTAVTLRFALVALRLPFAPPAPPGDLTIVTTLTVMPACRKNFCAACTRRALPIPHLFYPSNVAMPNVPPSPEEAL